MKVVIVSPNEADRTLASGFVAEGGLVEVQACDGMGDTACSLDPDVGCIVLVEEAMVREGMAAFQDALARQPAWSDIPVIVIAARASSMTSLVRTAFPLTGNITFLQRPLHPLTLVSAVHMAVRSRRRQFQVRDLLADRETALRRRDEFLAMLAHELRNPLAPIRNAVYLMGTLPNGDPNFRRWREMIDKQARHITRLVDDLLDVSRLELGKVELRRQRIDLNDAVAAAAEACSPKTSEHRHEMKVRKSPQPVVVWADPVRIEQAIGNLIVNAAKFTPAGGAIAVEASSDGDGAVVRVTDTGVGIRADKLESIFGLFAQNEVTLARTEGGLGIGLTLVKRLVEMHGGSVRAFSEGLGQGAMFEARLPLAGAEADAPELPKIEPGLARKRVLIAEDGDDTRESLGMLVTAWDHEVVYAANGPDAVTAAREERPDIALIDIGLPGFDGYSVAREIRAEGSTWAREVRLIALTGYGQASDRTRALEAGFDAHMLKPVDPAELQVALARPDKG